MLIGHSIQQILNYTISYCFEMLPANENKHSSEYTWGSNITSFSGLIAFVLFCTILSGKATSNIRPKLDMDDRKIRPDRAVHFLIFLHLRAQCWRFHFKEIRFI